MKNVGFIIALGLTLLSGCVTNKDWSATGGSRSDGVVRLSYEVGEFETPKLNEAQAIELASQRCKIWGYTGAQAFGGTTSQCGTAGGFSGCEKTIVTKEYNA